MYILLKNESILQQLNLLRLFSVCSSKISKFQFVPNHHPYQQNDLEQLQQFIDINKKLFVLTGAGISTESGIPDYRSENVGLYATSNRRPIQYKNFIESPKAQQSYWARSCMGWPRFSSFSPNKSHKAIADWEQRGKVHCVVTQNVDRLHQKAGSKYVVDLHGSLYQVHCIKCSYTIPRHRFQEELLSLNGYLTRESTVIRPDGDVELAEDEVQQFRVPSCPRCEGILKPYIVFFGDNVPRIRVEKVKHELESCDAFLAIGTSLTVYSAYRFVLQAVELKKPIAVINIGKTRGDVHAAFRIHARSGEILPLIKIRET